MTKTTRFFLKEEKKNSVVYSAAEADPLATSVYVSKSALPTPFPKAITLTLNTLTEVAS